MISKPLIFNEQKKFKKVERIEVKRCFVISQYIRHYDKGKKRYIPELSPEEFQKRLNQAKKIVLDFSETELDELIAGEYKKRLKAYNACDWYRGNVFSDEVGVWKKAGGLPLQWTEGSLKETAEKVKSALQDSSHPELIMRAKRAIPRIKKHFDIIENEPYLYPIILPGGTMERKELQRMKGDIDDGNMRSIAMAVSGKMKLNAYIGVYKK